MGMFRKEGRVHRIHHQFRDPAGERFVITPNGRFSYLLNDALVLVHQTLPKFQVSFRECIASVFVGSHVSILNQGFAEEDVARKHYTFQALKTTGFATSWRTFRDFLPGLFLAVGRMDTLSGKGRDKH